MGCENCPGCGSLVPESNMEFHRMVQCDAGPPESGADGNADGESQLTATKHEVDNED